MLFEREDSPLAAVLPWIVVAFALCSWLGRVDMLTPDEARHAEIAREMFQTGVWLTPRMYGEPYYDKPALFYWLIGASLTAFGRSAWAARIPSVAGAMFSIWMTAKWVGAAWTKSAARWATVLMATTLFFVAVGRYVVVDMLLTAALTGALAWMGIVLADGEDEKRAVWPMYVCTAVGVLAKGPVALVLVAGVAVVAALFERRPSLLLRLRPFRGLALVALLAGPWYAAAYAKDPEYIRTFLWHHNFARYAIPGALEHQQPWFFYLLALPVCLLPWSLLLPPALASAWPSPQAGVRHALAWATVVIGFFSFSQTKLPTYVLASFPPLLAIAAGYVDGLLRESPKPTKVFEAVAVGWSILVAAICVGGVLWLAIDSPSSWTRAVLATPALAISAWSYRYARTASALVTTIAASALALIAMVYGAAADAVNARESQRGAAAVVTDLVPPYAALTSYRQAPHALAFYAGRNIRRADDPEAAVPELVAGSDAALLTRAKFLPELGLDPLPTWMRIAWTAADGQVLVVGGRPAEELAERDEKWRRREGVEPSVGR